LSSSATPWKFDRRSGVCAGCESVFATGAQVTSALYEHEDEFRRADWCGTCFADPARRGDPYSHWTADVPEPQTRKAVFDQGVARDFLIRLIRENADARASLRYLLCLLLMRKRAVRVVEQRGGAGAETMVFTIPPDEDVHEIACPEIDEAEAESLREELGRLFDL
jgi:hypothetical protein